MLGQWDLLLQQLVGDALHEVKGSPHLLDDVFALLPPAQVAVIRDTFVETPIPVKLGFPRSAAELPGVFIVLGALREGEQVIGEAFGESVFHHEIEGAIGNALYWEDRVGTFVQETLRLCCWTENAALTVWLQNVVTWALLRRRSDLTEAGLLEQRLGATDFEPLPQWFPSFVYRRDVTLSGNSAATVIKKVLPIAAIQQTVTSGGETLTTYRE